MAIPPFPASQFDANQVLKYSFDDATGTLRTTATATVVSGDITIESSHIDDSMRLGDGTNYIGSVEENGQNGLSVNVNNSTPIPVTVVNGPGIDSVNIQDGGNSITIDAVSLPLPTGASTASNQVTANASLSSIDSKLTAPLSVTGPLTDVQLRATPVPVSAASLPLPTGAATSANQTTANSSLSSIDGKLNSLGQKTMANSVPVVIASDQAAIPVTATSSSTKTYRASVAALASANTATDIFTITGSGTATVKVLSIVVSTISTNVNNFSGALIKRSTANSGGTSTTRTAVPNDSNNAAATATVRAYTANPTLGTAVGTIVAARLWSSGGNTAASPITIFDFNASKAQPLILRGTSEVLALNLNSTTVTGGSFEIYIEWTEES